jgi:Zn-dependent peptidase ImmA (M78 family)/transcriptional regulator with XRE-family HTH domain
VTVQFNGDRLRVLRRFHDLSQRDLGARIGSPASTITGYERGRARPKGLALDALCAALDVNPEFFFDLTKDDEFQEAETNFRSLARTPEHLRKKILAHATLFAILMDYLTREVVALPRFNIPQASATTLDDLEVAAERCRVEMGVDLDRPIKSVTHMAEHAGVLVTVLDKSVSKEVDAFSRYGATSLIVLNPAKESATRARFDVAHEIAHGVLHRSGIPVELKVKEDQADYFASALLMPRQTFAREFWAHGRHRDWPQLFELKERWGASVSAIVVRAFHLGMIDAAEYRRRCKVMSKRGWFRSPEPVEPERESPQLFNVALNRFQRETGKTTAGIAADLNWTPTLFTEVTGVPVRDEGAVTSFEEFRQRRMSSG